METPPPPKETLAELHAKLVQLMAVEAQGGADDSLYAQIREVLEALESLKQHPAPE
jgi:hypothetical protein